LSKHFQKNKIDSFAVSVFSMMAEVKQKSSQGSLRRKSNEE